MNKEKIKLRRGAMKIQFTLTIVLIVVALVVIGIVRHNMKSRHEEDVLSSMVKENVEKIVEMASVKYNYTNVVSFKDNVKVSDMNIPFTTKKFLIKYDGYIKAGVDMKEASINMDGMKVIHVNLPRPKVLDNVIEEENTVVYDESDTIFNDLKYEDYKGVLVQEKKKVQEEAIKKGLFKEAKDNIRQFLNAYLGSLGYQKVDVRFYDENGKE